MNKKTWKVLGFVVFAAVLISIFIMPRPVVSNQGYGTCCYQKDAICVTPTENIHHYYFKEEGPCP